MSLREVNIMCKQSDFFFRIWLVAGVVLLTLFLSPIESTARMYMLTSDPVSPEEGTLSVGDDLLVELTHNGKTDKLINDEDQSPTSISPWLIYADAGDLIRIRATCAAEWETWRGEPFYTGKKWLSALYIVDLSDPHRNTVQIFSGLDATKNGQEEGGIFLDLKYSLGTPTRSWCLSCTQDACLPVTVDEDIKLISVAGNNLLTYDYVPDYNGMGRHTGVYDLVLPAGPMEISFNLIVVNRVKDGGVSPVYLYSPSTGRTIPIHPYGVSISGECKWFADCPEDIVLNAAMSIFLPGNVADNPIYLELNPVDGEGFEINFRKDIPDAVALTISSGDYLLGPDEKWSWKWLGSLPTSWITEESILESFLISPETAYQKMFTVGAHDVTYEFPDYCISETVTWNEEPTLGSLEEMDPDPPETHKNEEHALLSALTKADLQQTALDTFAKDPSGGIPISFSSFSNAQEEPEQWTCRVYPLGSHSFLDLGYHEIDVADLTFAAMVICDEGQEDGNVTLVKPPDEFGLMADLEMSQMVNTDGGNSTEMNVADVEVILDHRIDAEFVENAVIFYTTRLYSVGYDAPLLLDGVLHWIWTRDVADTASIYRDPVDIVQCAAEIGPAIAQVVSPDEEGFEDGIRVVPEFAGGRHSRFLVEFGADLVDRDGRYPSMEDTAGISLSEVWLKGEGDAVLTSFVRLLPDPQRPYRYRSGLIDADLIGADGTLPMAGETTKRDYRYEFKIRDKGVRLPGTLMRRSFFLGLPSTDVPFLVRGSAPDAIYVGSLDSGQSEESQELRVVLDAGYQEERRPLSLRFGLWKEERGTVYLKGQIPGMGKLVTSSDPEDVLWERFFAEDGGSYTVLSMPLEIPLDFFVFRYFGNYIWFVELLDSDTGETLFAGAGPLVIEP